MEVSYAFVVAMGMGVTFVGLTAIILLTMLMGKILSATAKPEPPKTAAVAAPTVAPAPVVSGDGIPEEVKVAILAALLQEPEYSVRGIASMEIKKL